MPADVAAPLPQLDLSPFAIVTVTLDDPGAVITSIALHGWQQIGGGPPVETVPALTWVSVPNEPPT